MAMLVAVVIVVPVLTAVTVGLAVEAGVMGATAVIVVQ